jgi:hypothetical protein
MRPIIRLALNGQDMDENRLSINIYTKAYIQNVNIGRLKIIIFAQNKN